MRANKKTILISVLIGVGFGFFISGIILSILLYTSNKDEYQPQDNQEVVQEVEHNENRKVVTEAAIYHIETTETLEKVEEPELKDEDNDQNDLNIETIELEIKGSATARDISKMLVENGVISDYDEFLAYIISKNADRSLSHGKKVFPLNSDVETVFKILTPYK